MKKNIPKIPLVDILTEVKASKIRRLAQSVPSAYSSANEVDSFIKGQRDDWENRISEIIPKTQKLFTNGRH